MRIILIAAFLLLALTVSISAYDGPVGMQSLQDMNNMPRMYDGALMYQASSYDRGEGNYDSGNFIRTEGNEYVMMEAKGPGQVCRLWLTNASPNHHVRVFIDGESKPRIDLTVTELFSGSIYPFVWPLVGNDSVSSGGYYCYVPIPFSNGCKITTDCKDLYYNVQYQLFDSAEGVVSYSACVDPRDAIQKWSQVSNAAGLKQIEKSVSVPSKGSADLLDISGSGRIVKIKINIGDIGDSERALSIYRDLWLRIYWDGSKQAAVDAPIGPFHLVWFPDSKAKALFLGSPSAGEFYCYYPMPFASGAKISLVNMSQYDIKNINAQIVVADSSESADIEAGRVGEYHALYKNQQLKERDPDYQFADLSGAGIALGATFLMIGAPERGQIFLEGDERIFYNGSDKPQLHGTGTEDFFNGGYYYDRGLFSLPLHGYNARRYETRDQEAMYRLYLADKIIFTKGFKAGIEHGATNDQDVDYSSVFYYYSALPKKTNAEKVKMAVETKQVICLSGYVKTSSGEAAAGAVVSVRKNGSIIASSLTCPDGSFEIRGIDPGTYDVRVESPQIVPYTVYDVKYESGKPKYMALIVESACANLLANGDFAKGFTAGTANGWSVLNTDNFTGIHSESENHEQKIHVAQPVDGDSYSGIYQKVQVIPSQIYTLKADCMTRYKGDEENPWDNVMAKVCVQPLGKEDFRSRDLDFITLPAEHDTWHAVNQKFAVVGDAATVYLAAWRKFPQGGDNADVYFKNASFTGPTVPPMMPEVTLAKWNGSSISLSWQSPNKNSRYAISRSKNESDIIGNWQRYDAQTIEIVPNGLKASSKCYALIKCQNKLGVWSEISVAEIN